MQPGLRTTPLADQFEEDFNELALQLFLNYCYVPLRCHNGFFLTEADWALLTPSSTRVVCFTC